MVGRGSMMTQVSTIILSIAFLSVVACTKKDASVSEAVSPPESIATITKDTPPPPESAPKVEVAAPAMPAPALSAQPTARPHKELKHSKGKSKKHAGKHRKHRAHKKHSKKA